jgi:hypothetical protein
MKFTTTENKTYRIGIGEIPKPWIEYKLKEYEEPDTIYKNAILTYFRNNIRLYDFDQAGDETHDFVFEDGKAFCLEYSWWSEWHHEDEEQNGIRDKYYIEEIALEDAQVPEKTMRRDWL